MNKKGMHTHFLKHYLGASEIFHALCTTVPYSHWENQYFRPSLCCQTKRVSGTVPFAHLKLILSLCLQSARSFARNPPSLGNKKREALKLLSGVGPEGFEPPTLWV